MLDQVVAARAFAARGVDDLVHGIQLVEARKDHRFFSDQSGGAAGVVDLLLGRLDEHEVRQDAEETVSGQHVFPEITRAVPGRVLWVAGAALDLARVAATVEWEKPGI